MLSANYFGISISATLYGVERIKVQSCLRCGARYGELVELTRAEFVTPQGCKDCQFPPNILE